MSIAVEFFGIPRARSGVARTAVLDELSSSSLADVLAAVGSQYPDFADACLVENRLRDGFVASIDGTCFVNDDEAVVESGQTVLILSADAGG